MRPAAKFVLYAASTLLWTRVGLASDPDIKTLLDRVAYTVVGGSAPSQVEARWQAKRLWLVSGPNVFAAFSRLLLVQGF